MAIAKYYLMGFGIMSLGFGLAYLLAPGALVEGAGFGSLSPAATTDVRATYGGFQIGMGAFLVWSSLAEERHRSALLLAFLSIGAVLVSRLIGLVLDGDFNAFHRMGLAFEVTLTAVTALILRKM